MSAGDRAPEPPGLVVPEEVAAGDAASRTC